MRADVHDDLRISQTQAHYVYKPTDEPCRDCSMFRRPNECTLVRGDIDPNGHCDYFEDK